MVNSNTTAYLQPIVINVSVTVEIPLIVNGNRFEESLTSFRQLAAAQLKDKFSDMEAAFQKAVDECLK